MYNFFSTFAIYKQSHTLASSLYRYIKQNVDYAAMDKIKKYFPELSDEQLYKFAQFDEIYKEWNNKINVISRKDIDNLYLHHVLHSLAIAKFLGKLEPGTTILDMGTGGGFPGIPLAVYYPHVKFHLIDRISKKIRVCNEVTSHLGLTNITMQQGDIGECHKKFDYVVSRAVMRLDALIPLVRKNIGKGTDNRYASGLICLKGSDIADESKGINVPVIDYPLSEFFNEEFFSTKSLIYVPMGK